MKLIDPDAEPIGISGVTAGDIELIACLVDPEGHEFCVLGAS